MSLFLFSRHPIIFHHIFLYSISNSFIFIYIAHSKRTQLHNHCIVYPHKCINMKHILIVYSVWRIWRSIFIADKQWNIYLAGALSIVESGFSMQKIEQTSREKLQREGQVRELRVIFCKFAFDEQSNHCNLWL